MQKKKKRIFVALLTAILVVALTGCSKLGSIINEIHGSLIGNNYTVYTYVVVLIGNQTLKTSGKGYRALPEIKSKPSAMTAMEEAVTGYDLSSVDQAHCPLMEKKSKAAEIPVYLRGMGWNRRWIFH